MTRALSSYPKHERNQVIRRRLAQDKIKGLGYWAAYDAHHKHRVGVSLRAVIRQAIAGD